MNDEKMTLLDPFDVLSITAFALRIIEMGEEDETICPFKCDGEVPGEAGEPIFHHHECPIRMAEDTLSILRRAEQVERRLYFVVRDARSRKD